MPKFTIERAHALGADEAKKRLLGLSDQLSAKYGLSAEWKTAHEAEVKGKGATGKITCAPTKVSIMIDLPFLLAPMKGKIEEKVTRELESALA